MMCLCFSALTVGAATAEDNDRYRDFTLGSTTASVLGLTGAPANELKTVHTRPALLQDLEWRPRYTPGRPIPDVDPVREIVFSFFNDQLYKIAVVYDENRTAGLTAPDIIDTLVPLYGPQTRPAGVALEEPSRSSGAPLLLAQWPGEDTSVSLFKSRYGTVYSLLVSSVRLEKLASQARNTALEMDIRDAPERDAARAKKQAEDARATDEKNRAANRGTFRP